MADVKTAWLAAKARLSIASSSPSLDAQVLLAHVLGTDNRAYLFAHPERELTPDESQHYADLINQRLRGVPVAYLRGYQEWYDGRFAVTPSVLIPRPETEHLLEAALEHLQTRPNAVVADVGTGSGALAVTVAAHHQGKVYATDISDDALTVARQNADARGVTVQFLQGDLLMPLVSAGITVDVLLSNPPYIAHDDMLTLDVSKHEPHLALDGGADGLDLIRRFFINVPTVCRSGALVLVEFGATQGDAVLHLAQTMLNPKQAEIRQDYAGHDRFLWALL